MNKRDFSHFFTQLELDNLYSTGQTSVEKVWTLVQFPGTTSTLSLYMVKCRMYKLPCTVTRALWRNSHTHTLTRRSYFRTLIYPSRWNLIKILFFLYSCMLKYDSFSIFLSLKETYLPSQKSKVWGRTIKYFFPKWKIGKPLQIA